VHDLLTLLLHLLLVHQGAKVAAEARVVDFGDLEAHFLHRDLLKILVASPIDKLTHFKSAFITRLPDWRGGIYDRVLRLELRVGRTQHPERVKVFARAARVPL